MMQLIAERLSGVPIDNYVSKAMQHGIDTEMSAITMYSLKTGIKVTPGFFVDDTEIDNFGATPDGFTPNGVLEVKCPNPATHVQYLYQPSLAVKKYYAQMQCQMSVTGRDHATFVSFDYRVPEKYQLLIVEVPADTPYIREMREKVSEFLEKIDTKIKELENDRVL